MEWVNVDNGNCQADFHFDITHTPWYGYFGVKDCQVPHPPDHYDRIDAIQVLEHVPKELFGKLIQEMYRVSKDGAIWNIAVPHGLSDNYITDPTHQMPFSTRTFDYFIDGTQLRENGIIYGWEDVHLYHVEPPTIDGNYSIIFRLGVQK